MKQDPFRLTKIQFKSDLRKTKPGNKWFEWPKCQSINVNLIDCQNGAEIELHAPSLDRDGSWLVLYLCNVCLSRYAKVKEGVVIHHRITDETIVYEVVTHDEIPF